MTDATSPALERCIEVSFVQLSSTGLSALWLGQFWKHLMNLDTPLVMKGKGIWPWGCPGDAGGCNVSQIWAHGLFVWAYQQIGICSHTNSMKKLRMSMTKRLPSWSANWRQALSHGRVPSPFRTLPHLDRDSSPEQTGRGNGPASLEAPVLSTARCQMNVRFYPVC